MARYLQEEAVIKDDESYFGVSVPPDEFNHDCFMEVIRETGLEYPDGRNISNFENKGNGVILNKGNLVRVKLMKNNKNGYEKTLYRVAKIRNNKVYLNPEPSGKGNSSIEIEFYNPSEYKMKCLFSENREYSGIIKTIESIKIMPDTNLANIFEVSTEQIVANLL